MGIIKLEKIIKSVFMPIEAKLQNISKVISVETTGCFKKYFPVRLLGTRFTNAISYFKPGSQLALQGHFFGTPCRRNLKVHKLKVAFFPYCM
jgi:hypothetical protein